MMISENTTRGQLQKTKKLRGCTTLVCDHNHVSFVVPKYLIIYLRVLHLLLAFRLEITVLVSVEMPQYNSDKDYTNGIRI